MGVDFSWHSGNTEPVLLETASRPRRAWRRLLVALLPIFVLIGLVAWQVRQGQEAARADLQRVVEREVAALAAGQREEFLSLLARSTPFYWYNYHDAAFWEESAWFAAHGAARVRVETVRLSADRATVEVALDDGQSTWRGTWHYRCMDGAWRHTAPPEVVLGERYTVTVDRATVTTQGLGEAETGHLAAEVAALYEDLVGLYGLPPEAAMAPVAGSREPPSPPRIAIEVTPSHHTSASGWSVGGGYMRLSIAVPSPQLGLELRTPEEQNAYLRRSVRLGVASALLRRRSYMPAQALALWHAQAWEPEWEACARAAVADDTWRRYLQLWWEPEAVEDDGWWREVLGRYEGASEGVMLQALYDWMGAMSYSMGEFLSITYPPERLAALLQMGDRTWWDLEAELDLTREDLEAEWGAFLRERYGQ